MLFSASPRFVPSKYKMNGFAEEPDCVDVNTVQLHLCVNTWMDIDLCFIYCSALVDNIVLLKIFR